MSVAIGIAQPETSGVPAVSAKKISAGPTIPPSAAAIGSAAWRGVASSPTRISRFISSPTTKKKIAIKPSLTQWSSDSLMAKLPTPRVIFVCQRLK